MRRPRRPFGIVLAVTTALSLSLSLAAPGIARAQSTLTPPTRVGQVASINGQVSFADNATQGWTQATLNYPIVSGDALYTQPGARASIAIDASRITLNSGAELTFTHLGNRSVTAALAQGEVFFDLRYLAPGDSYAITTPRGTVTLSQNGRYDIIAGDANRPTEISTVRGNAALQTQDVALTITAGQTAYLQGSQPVSASLTPLRRDRFIESFNQTAYIAPPSYVPSSVEQMTGAAQLSAYGSWQQAPNYGAIWYPTVPPGWVPYHYGHRAYVAPWGWTWVDNEPWGFAPFHYGRWVQYGGRWGWAPAYEGAPYNPYQPPVYAPALVSFFSVGSGVAISVGLGVGAFAEGNIGWVPLGPQEPYLPWYRCRPDYVRDLNVGDVRNINRVTTIYNNNTTVVNNTRIINNYYGPTRLINRGAATVIPAAAMRQGLAVQGVARPAPQVILAAAHPIAPASVPHFGALRLGPAHPGMVAGPNPGLIARPGQPIHAIPAAMRLPAPPISTPRRAAAAPRPAPFAAARGLPVAHPGPVHGIAARPITLQRVPMPSQGTNRAQPGPLQYHAPTQSFRPPPLPHVLTPALHQPGAHQPVAHQPVAHQPISHAPVQQFHAPVQTFHPPVNRSPLVHPPAFHPPAFHPPVIHTPAFHPPAQTFHPPAQPYHPPIYHPPVFHPPVQTYHPPVFHPPVFHPPVQTFRPPVQTFHPPVFHPQPRPIAPIQRDPQHP